MSSTLEKKKALVEEITEKFRDSQSTIIVDYRGLNVAEITELRKNLREAGIDFHVYKNTMSKRAAEKAELSDLNETLVGPTAIAFSNEDVVAPAKILSEFSKDNENLEIKGGVIEGEIATLEEIKELSSLPNYEGMLSMLLSVLQAPIRDFAYAVKAVGEEKEDGSEEESEE